jgi:hypothetical protein
MSLPQPIQAAAAEWHARITGIFASGTEESLNAIWPDFERWLLADPRHHLAYHRLEYGKDPSPAQVRQLEEIALTHRKRVWQRRSWWIIVLLVVAALFVAVAWLSSRELKCFTCPDGRVRSSADWEFYHDDGSAYGIPARVSRDTQDLGVTPSVLRKSVTNAPGC